VSCRKIAPEFRSEDGEIVVVASVRRVGRTVLAVLAVAQRPRTSAMRCAVSDWTARDAGCVDV
jgi:hypothetical protein